MNNTLMRILMITLFLSTVRADTWTNTQEAANRLGAAEYKEISFEMNSSSLTAEQKEEIRNVVNDAAKNGKIVEVKVLTWSDKEYPSEKGKQGREDIQLAKNRAKDLKAFIKEDLKVSKVNTYNMTERPNALQKMLSTPTAKVKTAAEESGAAPTAGNTGIFDMKAQASKGVVMIFMKK